MKQAIALLFALFTTLACQKAPAQSANTQASAALSAKPAAAATAPQATTPAAPQPAPAGAAQTPPAPAPGQAPGADPASAVKPVPAQLPDVVARVNGEAINKSELERAVKSVEARAGGAVPADQRDRLYRGVLDELVAMHLLLQESKSRNIAIADADIDARLTQVKSQFPSEAEFEKALSSRGMTVAQLRQEARDQAAIQKLVEAEVAPKVKVAEGEAKTFYDQNPKEFQQPEGYRASHILLRVENTATPAQKAEAKAKGDDLLKQLKGGADFADLAKANSQDGSAANGGDLGTFGKGQMVPAFEQAVAALKPGEISGVVETPFGYHIIKLVEVQPARTVPFAEVSQKITQFLQMRGQQEQAVVYVQTLKAKGKVEILI